MTFFEVAREKGGKSTSRRVWMLPQVIALLLALGVSPAYALIQIEAEDMTLDTYKVEDNPLASGQKLISLLDEPLETIGTASTIFTGPPGMYTIVVNHIDENDGSALLKLHINDIFFESWELNGNFGTATDTIESFTARNLGKVLLLPGDSLTIIGTKRGTEQKSENARVDFIQLIPEPDDSTLFSREAEADTTVLSGAVEKISPNDPDGTDARGRGVSVGFSGDGYVAFTGEGTVEWPRHFDATGDYTLEFRYSLALPPDDARSFKIYLDNSLVVSNLRFAGTNHATVWKTAHAIIHVDLKVVDANGGMRDEPDTKTIRLETMGPGGPNLDYLIVSPVKFMTGGNTNSMNESSIAPSPSANTPECSSDGSRDDGYANSYYGKVDPNCKRSTLDAFKRENGFSDRTPPDEFDSFSCPPRESRSDSSSCALYINALDLGFGRKMFCRNNDMGRAACYVHNYLNPKTSSQLIATVAMERIELAGRQVVAFFIYDQDRNRVNDITDGHRINQLALDSEGAKSNPESCYACHFGVTKKPAVMAAVGEPAGGQFLPFDIDSFENWPGRPTLADQLEEFRGLNDIVWQDAMKAHGSPAIRELIEGWYEGPPSNGNDYDPLRLPVPGWYTDSQGFEAPVGSVTFDRYFRQRFLYQEVYAKFCRACHSAQTMIVDDQRRVVDWQEAEAFELDAFIHICNPGANRPVMPNAEVTFNKFSGDFIRFTNGQISTARDQLCAETRIRPRANAGSNQTLTLAPNQTTRSVTLDGSLSSDPDGVVQQYLWSVSQSASPDLDPVMNVANPVVELDVAGTYVFNLVVVDNDGLRSSNPASVTITVEGGERPEEPSPSRVNYAAVQAIFSARCVECHNGGQAPDLRMGMSYAQIVNVGPNAQLIRITPRNLNTSNLYQRVIGNPTFMPPPPEMPLSDAQMTTLRRWITQGAQCTTSDRSGGFCQ